MTLIKIGDIQRARAIMKPENQPNAELRTMLSGKNFAATIYSKRIAVAAYERTPTRFLSQNAINPFSPVLIGIRGHDYGLRFRWVILQPTNFYPSARNCETIIREGIYKVERLAKRKRGRTRFAEFSYRESGLIHNSRLVTHYELQITYL